MKKRFSKILAIVVAATMVFSGCGAGGSEASGEKKHVRLISGGEPGSLHPSLAQGTHESIILDHVFEGLMKRNQEGKIVEGMAKEYTIGEDNLTYTFTLRDDIKWSNGEDVTALDFEYAWKFALNPNSASDYAYQLYYLEGGEAFNTADVSTISEEDFKALEDAVGVKALDEKTLEVKLGQPTPYFLELCAFYTYYPVCKSVQEDDPAWAENGKTHVSNGPFKIIEWNHDQSVVATKNEHYYNKDAVKLTDLTFYISEDGNTEWQMYQNDEIDINNNIPPEVLGQLRSEKNPELLTKTELSTYFYRVNTSTPPFSNKKIRQALSMAINRQSIVEDVAQGGQIPAYGLVPAGVADVDGDFRENGGDYIKEDLEAAKALLAEGLAEEGLNNLEFTILYNTNEGHKKIAEAVQQMWKDLGVDVQLENTEFRVKLEREHALDYQVSRAGWVGDYVDPNTFLDMFTSWSTQNDTGWSTDAYDELIRNAAIEFDATKRMEYLHDAEAMLMDAQPIIPIYYYTKNIMIKPYLVGATKVINREISVVYADIVNK